MGNEFLKAITRAFIGAAMLAPTLSFSHQYSALIAERRYAEADAEVSRHLKDAPKDADALMAKSELILAQSQTERLDESLAAAEKCAEWHPNNSGCYEALGNASAAKASSSNFAAAFVLAGKTRESYLKAIEKDANNFRARISLIKFYLQAPSIVGGGSGKARALATETAAISRDVGNLAFALCDLNDGNESKAEAAILAANLNNFADLAGPQRDLLFSLGQRNLAKKQFPDAKRLFSEIQRRSPSSELYSYGMGLAAQEQGRNDEALRYFENALAQNPRAYIYYSIGYSAVAQKDRARAIQSFQQALDFKPPLSKKMRADASAQLDELRSK